MEHIFTDANFSDDVLQSSVPVLVDFWAEWCGPCRAMGPVIEELANEIAETKLKIGKMNVDQNADTPQKYNVSSIPTFLLFKNGQVADQFVGTMSKSVLFEKLQKHFA
jgi:thioredoxin 1